MSESQIVNEILDWLLCSGIPAWRNNTGTFKVGKHFVSTSVKGASDIVGVLPGSGRMLCIEAKMEKGRLSPDQTRFISTVRDCGGVAYMARSAGDAYRTLLENLTPAEMERTCGTLFDPSEEPEE